MNERTHAPGSVVVASLEGTRPLMLEVQALVSRTHFGFPKRMVTGLDANRTLLLIAVLEKRLGLHLESEDVFVNIVGGVKIKEPAIDLGVALAVASAHRNQTLDPATVRPEESGMSDTTRMILIALAVALVVVILVPVLFMGGMMGAMMGGGMMSGGAWVMIGLVLLILVAGGAALTAGLRR